MEFHNLEQGTPEWHKLRDTHMTASDASAMMGASKYKSRNQLLSEKKFGIKEEINKSKQAIFDKGHQTEDMARNLIEVDYLESFSPEVITSTIDGVNLLASLDGLSEDGSIIFEHKLYNKTLAENVRNGVLEPSHYWQLEQQLLVSGAEKVLFVTSDGTTENREQMFYSSVDVRRDQLISGWKQFIKDMESHELKAKKEVVEASVDSLPAIVCKVENGEIQTNISSCLLEIKDLAAKEIGKPLETDLDFANKEQLNKDVKALRSKLTEKVAQVRGEFVSYSDFEELANELDGVLQKMQADGEKKVKAEKESKKRKIAEKGQKDLEQCIAIANGKLSPFSVQSIAGDIKPDWPMAMKNKRTIESVENAVSDELAKHSAAIETLVEACSPNIAFLISRASEYEFLFNDAPSLVNQSEEAFKAVVESRISAHEKDQADKIEAQREEIRKEEEAKILQKKNDEDEWRNACNYVLGQLNSEEAKDAIMFLDSRSSSAGDPIYDECSKKARAHYDSLIANESSAKRPTDSKGHPLDCKGCPDCMPVGDDVTNEACRIALEESEIKAPKTKKELLWDLVSSFAYENGIPSSKVDALEVEFNEIY